MPGEASRWARLDRAVCFVTRSIPRFLGMAGSQTESADSPRDLRESSRVLGVGSAKLSRIGVP